jgi:2-polyprenyl-3-methyl-5-hydroxy-6-metoxy-1,4-benzoquinol methylase
MSPRMAPKPDSPAATPAQGEAQYRARVDLIKARGGERLGLMTAWAWYDDPKRLTFTLARYKFVAKMLAGAGSVLEVGCSDGFASRIVAQDVKSLTAVDFDPEFIDDARARNSDRWPIEFRLHDLTAGSVQGEFEAAYALDVLEHIPVADEVAFLRNLIAPVRAQGVVILGMPSLQSQKYASPQSREGHVNCKDQKSFKALMETMFHTVLMFSMNDEVVHTGYAPMAHYLFAVCCGKKPQ